MAVTEQKVAMAPAASAECSSLMQHIPTPVRSSTFVFGTLVPRVGIHNLDGYPGLLHGDVHGFITGRGQRQVSNRGRCLRPLHRAALTLTPHWAASAFSGQAQKVEMHSSGGGA